MLFNKMHSRCSEIQQLVRRLVLASIRYNFHLWSRWISTNDNTVADCLSRLFCISTFHLISGFYYVDLIYSHSGFSLI